MGPKRLKITFKVQDIPHGFPRWFLMFADYAEILEPESLNIRVKEILSKDVRKLEG